MFHYKSAVKASLLMKFQTRLSNKVRASGPSQVPCTLWRFIQKMSLVLHTLLRVANKCCYQFGTSSKLLIITALPNQVQSHPKIVSQNRRSSLRKKILERNADLLTSRVKDKNFCQEKYGARKTYQMTICHWRAHH